MPPSRIMKKAMSFRKLRNLLLATLTISLPILIIILFAKDIRNIERYIPTTGIAGPLFSILLMGILSATPIPTDPIVILNGAIFGPFMGIIVSWAGNNLASIIEYWIGRAIGTFSDFEKQKRKLPFGLDKFPADSPWFLIGGRFIPSFGGKLVSLAGGVYHVNFFRYLWTATIANLIGSIFFAYGGHLLLYLTR